MPRVLRCSTILFLAALPARAAAQPSSDTLASLVATGKTTCAVTTSGQAYCWGRSHPAPYRVLGPEGTPVRFGSPTPRTWARCGLDTAGNPLCDAALRGWTDSAGKAIPIPPGADCRLGECRTLVPVTRIPTDAPLQELTAGGHHACALALNGKAFCWGHNHMGQLGTGTWSTAQGSLGEPVSTPTAVIGGLRFAQLAAGWDFTCGISRIGATVHCWGYGQQGQTGDSSVTTYCKGPAGYPNQACSNPRPARVATESLPGDWRARNGVRFVQVSAGMGLACATSQDGGAWCWGSNYRCALGRCGTPDSPVARRVQIPGRVVEVGAGYWHACARTADARIFCWGDNRIGQLGSLVTANAGPDGGPPDYRPRGQHQTAGGSEDPCFLGGRCSPAPVEVSPGRRWAALAVGSDHACALDAADGGVYCWGGTDAGVFGGGAAFVPCENRSPDWKDEPCQAVPVRVPGLPYLAVRLRSSQPRVRPRVVVSRREVRVVFPRDTLRAWGWPEQLNPNLDRRYIWTLDVPGPTGSRSLSLVVGPADSSARDFPSLAALVAQGTASLCRAGGLMASCDDSEVIASVVDGSVVLSLRGRSRISELFRLKPAFGGTWQRKPYDELAFTRDSVPVEYVAPLIPEPDSAMRAEAARQGREHEARRHRVSRRIVGGTEHSESLWLEVGDSAIVSVQELSCRDDLCMGGWAVVSDSGWRLGDSSVAALRVVPRQPIGFPSQAVVMARSPGRTLLRADSVSREVVVTAPIARVTIVPPADSIVVGEPVEFGVLVVDRQGRHLEGVPIVWKRDTGRYHVVQSGPAPLRVAFEATGRRMIIASFANRADTLVVNVKPKP
ncbi:MAG TPA: hypothetical protein VLB00_16205 [Gemmatimonadales bacterium]|nr:hypothetical protein [Gemmatimonadales bacterium]